MNTRGLLAGVMIASLLSGCASTGFDPETGLYAAPVGGAPATANATPITPALTCLASSAVGRGVAAPRIAVGEIADLTGKLDLETGRRVSQGASLFAVTAFGRAGVPLVERADQTVAEVERTYATAQVLSDTPTGAGEAPGPVRPVNAGQIAGSRYYLVGGITELNYNISSSGGEAALGSLDADEAKTIFGASRFVMNVAIDLRLVDSVSQEVVAIAAYQKQIVGREIRAGVFDILGGVLVDLSGGQSALEPLQLGVRALIERGVFDVSAELYGLTGSTCLPADQTIDTSGGYRRLRAFASPLPITVPIAPTTSVAAETRQAPAAVQGMANVAATAPSSIMAYAPRGYGAEAPAPAASYAPDRAAAPWTVVRPRLDPNGWRVRRETAPGAEMGLNTRSSNPGPEANEGARPDAMERNRQPFYGPGRLRAGG
ncbi:holdfast anchoring protein HfaB [Brevundimonas subvibrioides]|uniref:holdfast anchoring protein HfaB n=1 Tax=Brevundimonas subvibrioides TaxID=74313 RepID=UPI0022B57282|nr:holdfast anchoring protein HfaB [Brevundimonas subvibrioides]